MNDPMQVARARCEALRRETRELEEFIRFGEALLKGNHPSKTSLASSGGDAPSRDVAVGEN